MSGPKETQQEMKNKVTDICQSGKCKKDISKDVGLQQITVRAIINKQKKPAIAGTFLPKLLRECQALSFLFPTAQVGLNSIFLHKIN